MEIVTRAEDNTRCEKYLCYYTNPHKLCESGVRIVVAF